MKRSFIIIKPDGTIERSTLDKPATLEQLQKAVDGYIEPVRVRFEGKVRRAFVNEEGLLRGLPLNRTASKMALEYGYAMQLVGNLVMDFPTPKEPKS